LARKAYASIALRVGVKEFSDTVEEIHKDGQKLVYPDSIASELIGLKDKNLIGLYLSTLTKEYPEKADKIAAEYKVLLSQKK